MKKYIFSCILLSVFLMGCNSNENVESSETVSSFEPVSTQITTQIAEHTEITTEHLKEKILFKGNYDIDNDGFAELIQRCENEKEGEYYKVFDSDSDEPEVIEVDKYDNHSFSHSLGLMYDPDTDLYYFGKIQSSNRYGLYYYRWDNIHSSGNEYRWEVQPGTPENIPVYVWLNQESTGDDTEEVLAYMRRLETIDCVHTYFEDLKGGFSEAITDIYDFLPKRD